MTTEFSTVAKLRIEVDERSLRQAEQQISDRMGSVRPGVTDGGRDRPAGAVRPGASGGSGLGSTTGLLSAQLEKLEDIEERIEQLAVSQSGDGGGGLGGLGAAGLASRAAGGIGSVGALGIGAFSALSVGGGMLANSAFQNYDPSKDPKRFNKLAKQTTGRSLEQLRQPGQQLSDAADEAINGAAADLQDAIRGIEPPTLRLPDPADVSNLVLGLPGASAVSSLALGLPGASAVSSLALGLPGADAVDDLVLGVPGESSLPNLDVTDQLPTLDVPKPEWVQRILGQQSSPSGGGGGGGSFYGIGGFIDELFGGGGGSNSSSNNSSTNAAAARSNGDMEFNYSPTFELSGVEELNRQFEQDKRELERRINELERAFR